MPNEFIDSPRTATTTSEEDRKTAAQRRINVKWESTQQIIAIAVTIIVLNICAYVVIYGDTTLRLPAFLFLTNIAVLVIGTYFQRTNHTKSSGSSDSR